MTRGRWRSSVTGLVWMWAVTVAPRAPEPRASARSAVQVDWSEHVPVHAAAVQPKLVQVAQLATAKGVFTLSAKPAWDIGGVQSSPDNEFDSRDDAVRAVMLGSGGIAVNDLSRVRLFDAGGKQRTVVGRFGHGPHEFARLNVICKTRGDTLVVWDQNSRNTVIAPNGTIVRQWNTGQLGYSTDVCFDDGTMLLQTFWSNGDNSPSRALSLVDLSGRLVQKLGVYPRTVTKVTRPAKVTLGRMLNTFFIANSRTLDIQRYSNTGELLTVLKLHEKEETMTGNDLRPWIFNKYVPGEKPPPPLHLTQVTVWPFYNDVLTDELGRWWVQDFERDFIKRDKPVVWTAIDSTGKLIGRLSIPRVKRPENIEDIEVSAFTAKGVFVRCRDSDGAVHFRFYNLSFRSGR